MISSVAKAKVNGSMIPARAENGDIGIGKSANFDVFPGPARRISPITQDFS
jgi:hypothetical protein